MPAEIMRPASLRACVSYTARWARTSASLRASARHIRNRKKASSLIQYPQSVNCHAICRTSGVKLIIASGSYISALSHCMNARHLQLIPSGRARELAIACHSARRFGPSELSAEFYAIFRSTSQGA